MESRAFLDIKELPKSMIVMGGGFIGCELACMAAMLGVKVTIVELLEDILLLLDADVRREVAHRVERTARETRDSLLIIVLLRPLPSLTIVVTLARGLEGSTCRRTHQGAGGQVLSRAR